LPNQYIYEQVGRRLGLDKKRNYPRFENMLSMFGMHRQAEINKRTPEYRVWTAGNSNSDTPIAVLCKSKAVLGDNNISDLNTSNVDVPVRSDVGLLEHGNSTLGIYSASSGKLNEEIDTDVYSGSPEDGKTNHMQLCPGNVPDSLNRPRSTASNAEIYIESMQMEPDGASSVKTTPTLLTPHHSGSSQTYPHMPLTADSAFREKKILEWLQVFHHSLHEAYAKRLTNSCIFFDVSCNCLSSNSFSICLFCVGQDIHFET
jgi:general transcription factor 3C polypeptide 1